MKFLIQVTCFVWVLFLLNLGENEAKETDTELARDDDPIAVNASIVEAMAAINETVLHPHNLTLEEEKYVMMSFDERINVTRSHIGPEGRGFGDIVKFAVSLVGGIAKEGISAVTSVVGHFVNFGDIGLKIGKKVEEMVDKYESTVGFLNGLMYEILYHTEELCNVLVFNLNKWHILGVTGVKHFQRVTYKYQSYGVYVFEGGYFKNLDLFKDDKWGFGGDVTLGGLFKDTVKFRHRPCPKSR